MAKRSDLRKAFADELSSALSGASGLASRVVEAAHLFEFEAKLSGADVTRLQKSPEAVDLGKFEACADALERLGRSNDRLREVVRDLIEAERLSGSLPRKRETLLPNEALELARKALDGALPPYAAYEALSESWSTYRHTKYGCGLRTAVEESLRSLLLGWSPALKARIVRAASARITEDGQVPDAPDPDAIDAKFEDWHARLEQSTRTVVSGRSRMSQFTWPQPYGNGWIYADQEIECMLASKDAASEEWKSYSEGNSAPADFFRGRIHAYLFDPESFEKLDSTRYILSESDPFRIPRDFADIVPRALFPFYSGSHTYFDSDLARMDVNLTRVNEGVRIGRTTFSTVVATHHVTGQVMYDDHGAEIFDGFSHICHKNRFLLLHSQAAANSIAVSCIAITADHQVALILRGGHENVFGHASWRPPVTGAMNVGDFSEGDTKRLFADAVRRAVRRITVFELLGGDDSRPIEDERIEFVGYANAVANGKRPCAFAVVHLLHTSRELQGLNPGTFMEFFDLVPDNHSISALELLGLDPYAEAETLRANVMLYIKYRAYRKSRTR